MRDLIFEVVDGVATISINRPRARNALAHQTITELDEAIELPRNDSRVLIIRGEGDSASCAGGDLKELEHMRSAEEAASMAHRMRATLDNLPQLPFPVIAALNASTWADPAHWEVAARLDRRRREQR